MISDKLLALRKRSGMSQQEVVSAIGVTRQTVGNWELGQGSPALDKAAELARLYGVTLDDLANDEVEYIRFSLLLARRGALVRRNYNRKSSIFLRGFRRRTHSARGR